MKRLTREEIIGMIEKKIEIEKEYEETYSRNHHFEYALMHAKRRFTLEELLDDIDHAEERK